MRVFETKNVNSNVDLPLPSTNGGEGVRLALLIDMLGCFLCTLATTNTPKTFSDHLGTLTVKTSLLAQPQWAFD